MANLQPLRTYIRQNLAHLRTKPCLLISSTPPPTTVSTAIAGTKSPSSITTLDDQQRQSQTAQLKFQQQQTHPKVHSFVERNVQSLTMEFGLRSVHSHVSSAFPTIGSVNEAVLLAKRAGLKEGTGGGDGVVIGIGSGAAMDLAKAVADSLFGNVGSYNVDDGNDGLEGGSLVLAPCTLGGLWAASSNSPSILLDTKEEMLLPHLSSSWNNAISSGNVACKRMGTIVTLDPTQYLALPPLYTPFHPVKRSEFIAPPSMAHVAAAAIVTVLDTARSLDVATKTGMDDRHSDIHNRVLDEMISVAASCASVLELAATEAKSDNGDNNIDNTKVIAHQHILDAIPRLSQLVEQASLLTQSPTAITGTIPQRLANALLPAYFPQCHLITYLACILPGLCDVLSENASSLLSSDEGSMVEAIAKSILHGSSTTTNPVEVSLSPWASQVTMEAGIPSMAGLAYGTPDLNTLMGNLDSYETLVASLNGGLGSGGGGQDEYLIMEDILQRSLNR